MSHPKVKVYFTVGIKQIKTCNPRTWGVEAREFKFKASLSCIAKFCFRKEKKRRRRNREWETGRECREFAKNVLFLPV